MAAEQVASAEIVWIRQFEPDARGVAVDADGDAYVVGGRVGALVNNACSTHWLTDDRGASLHKYDANGDEAWMRSFGNGSIGATAVAVDSTGAYVTGGTIGEFPGFHNGGFVDAYVLKYNAHGNVVWAQQFGGSGLDAGYGIDVDATAVYVAGGSTCSGEMGGHAFVAKFDLDGNLLWTQRAGSGGDDRARAIAVGPSGVYVALDLGHRAWLLRLDPNGTGVWIRALSGFGCATAVAADGSGIYAAGYTNWVCTDNFPFSGYTDAILQKHDVDGNAIWTRQFGTPGNDSAFGVSVHAKGVYVTGTTDGTFPDQVNSGSFDAFVRRHSADGDEGWTLQFGSSSSDIGRDIDVGCFGIYAAGGHFAAKLMEGGMNAGPNLRAITVQPASSLVGQDVILAATASDPDGDVVGYSWDFGDGVTATGRTAAGGGSISATHAYLMAGAYTVSLSVNDGEGCAAAKSASVRIVAPVSVEVSAQPIVGMVPLTVSFDPSPSGGVPPYSFLWDFGDGGSSTERDPTHTYEVAGTYIVTLDIRDADGHSTSKTIQITVTLPPPVLLLAGVTGGIAVAAIGVGFLLLRRKRASR